MRTEYADIPILDAARRCGVRIDIDARTLGRREARARCPFCGDKPRKGSGHLFMNTEKNQYFCFLCGAKGNSVSLYARLQCPPISFGEAARELASERGAYGPPNPRNAEPGPAVRSVAERSAVYTALLGHLALEKTHLENLTRRGLSVERIKRNMYRSLPGSESAKLSLARMLADFYGLSGIPGFYRTRRGLWDIAAKSPGLLIPVRDKDGLIQGMQIRTDDAGAERKYRWLSSTGLKDGTGSGSPIHVTGDIAQSIAYVTEGPLKGDAASFLDKDAPFVCVAGVNAVRGLKEAIASIGAKNVVVAFDMDKTDNRNVGKAAENVMRELSRANGLRVAAKNWDAAHNGIDDYYLGLRKAAA